MINVDEKRGFGDDYPEFGIFMEARIQTEKSKKKKKGFTKF